MRFFHKQHVDALATGVNCAGNFANELSKPSRFAAVPSRPTAQLRELLSKESMKVEGGIRKENDFHFLLPNS
jgi:hypothetical protein